MSPKQKIKSINNIKIGVIPAAGKGTRFGYLSHLLPKALLPLYNRPILHHVIDHLLETHIEDIYIIVHAGKERILDYCKHLPLPKGVKIHFVEQKKLEGLASAILLMEKYVKNQPFLVVLGDDCTISNSFPKLVNFFIKQEVLSMEAVVKEKRLHILKQTNSVKLGKKGSILEIIEKPKNPKYPYRGCGIYLFRPEIFSYIKKTPISSIRNEREITHTLQLLAKEGKAYGYLLKGINININNYDDLLKASKLIQSYTKNP